jgi:hypothetical protein
VNDFEFVPQRTLPSASTFPFIPIIVMQIPLSAIMSSYFRLPVVSMVNFRISTIILSESKRVTDEKCTQSCFRTTRPKKKTEKNTFDKMILHKMVYVSADSIFQSKIKMPFLSFSKRLFSNSYCRKRFEEV